MSRSSLGFVQAGTFKAILSPKLSTAGSMQGSISNCSLLTSSNPRHTHTPHYQRNKSGFSRSDCHLRWQRAAFLSSYFMDQTESNRQDTPSHPDNSPVTVCTPSSSSSPFYRKREKKLKRREKKDRNQGQRTGSIGLKK